MHKKTFKFIYLLHFVNVVLASIIMEMVCF